MTAENKTVAFPNITPGYLIPIGGSERKRHDPEILRRFIDLSGGADASIVIIPTASKLQNTGERYEEIFLSMGADSAVSLRFKDRSDCNRPEWLEILQDATGVFLTGGSQLRLSSTLGGTPVTKDLRRLHRSGVPIAGSSAGASYMSEHMIAFGESGASPTTHKVALVPGLGLNRDFTIDQHFKERDRLGRLLTALAYNPEIMGLGLDEDTAAVIAPDRTFEVIGSGTCTVLDGADLEYSALGREVGDPICLLGARLHVLTAGCGYAIDSRRPLAPGETLSDLEDPTTTPESSKRKDR